MKHWTDIRTSSELKTYQKYFRTLVKVVQDEIRAEMQAYLDKHKHFSVIKDDKADKASTSREPRVKARRPRRKSLKPTW